MEIFDLQLFCLTVPLIWTIACVPFPRSWNSAAFCVTPLETVAMFLDLQVSRGNTAGWLPDDRSLPWAIVVAWLPAPFSSNTPWSVRCMGASRYQDYPHRQHSPHVTINDKGLSYCSLPLPVWCYDVSLLCLAWFGVCPDFNNSWLGIHLVWIY